MDCQVGKPTSNDQKSATSEKLDSSFSLQNAKILNKSQEAGFTKAIQPKRYAFLKKLTILGFLRFAGVNAIYFYIAQGISASLLFPILRHFPPLAWWVKLPLAFCINLSLCVVFVWILIYIFSTISSLGRRLTH